MDYYSGGDTGKGELNTPIIKELEAIFANSKKHTILIDDARCFNGTNDYPKINTLKEYVLEKNSKLLFNVKDDIIHISPNELKFLNKKDISAFVPKFLKKQ